MVSDGTQIFKAKDQLLSTLGWNENPFIKDLRLADKGEFLKYYCPLDGERLLERLAFDAKAVMLLGPKGVGKTSAAYFTRYSLPEAEYDSIVLKEPPADLDSLAAELGVGNKTSALGGILNVIGLGSKPAPITRAQLAERLRNLKKKTIVFVDEAHSASNPQIYMEFKYLLDEVPQLRMVLCGLDRAPFPDSLMHLVGENNVFSRKGFTAGEMGRIVSHRIEAVGGNGTHPFSKGALDDIFTEQNLLTPRYVFDELNNRLAQMAIGKIDMKQESSRLSVNDPIVQAAVMDVKQRKAEHEGGANSQAPSKLTKMHADWWVMLSPSQESIMKLLLNRGDGATLNEICKEASLAENTAFNALYQLRGDDARERERKKEVPFPLVEVKHKLVGGRKKNLYFVAAKVRNLFTTT